MITYEEVGKQAGLSGYVLESFIRYMKTRWAKDEERHCLVGYALEWAQRFEAGIEYECSDSAGKTILETKAW